MAAETAGAGTAAAIKYIGLPAIAGAMSAGLGFAVLWPKTAKEAAARFTTAILSSCLFGPFAIASLHAKWPELFASAAQMAVQSDMPPLVGWVAVVAPLLVLCGLPAWWVLGWVMRALDKRKDKDLGEIVDEVKGKL
jgi:hypothetical protein